MGCVCCSLSSFVSIVLNALERITLCTVCAMLTCCLLFTILSVLVMGIGIGFHYCAVQNSVNAMEQAARSVGALRSGDTKESPAMRSVNKAVKRGFAHRLNKRDKADALMPSNNNTINDRILFERNSTSNNTYNTDEISGRNFTVTSDRDLVHVQTLPLLVNDTRNEKLLFNFTKLNDSLSSFTRFF